MPAHVVSNTSPSLALNGSLGGKMCPRLGVIVFGTLLAVLGVSTSSAARVKPAKTPKPSASASSTARPIVPAPEKPSARVTPKVELAVCSADVIDGAEGNTLLALIRRQCRKVSDEDLTASDLSRTDTLVLACTLGDVLVASRQCGLAAQALVSTDDAVEPLLPIKRGGALQLTGVAVFDLGDVHNGTLVTVAASSRLKSMPIGADLATPEAADDEDVGETRSIHLTLVLRKRTEGYGFGSFWIPAPMFTTDFSRAASGYRFGFTPIAIASGFRFYPSASRLHLGLSLFAGWNVLLPNDTQTLTNGTEVRVNFKALGVGVLADVGGIFGLGLGVGHTFTTDSRTDLRGFFWVGSGLIRLLTEGR